MKALNAWGRFWIGQARIAFWRRVVWLGLALQDLGHRLRVRGFCGHGRARAWQDGRRAGVALISVAHPYRPEDRR